MLQTPLQQQMFSVDGMAQELAAQPAEVQATIDRRGIAATIYFDGKAYFGGTVLAAIRGEFAVRITAPPTPPATRPARRR